MFLRPPPLPLVSSLTSLLSVSASDSLYSHRSPSSLPLVCICAYVFIHVFMHVCVYTCVHVCAHVDLSVCAYACMRG